MSVSKFSLNRNRRIFLLLLVGLPALGWALVQRLQWQAHQHTLEVRIEPATGASPALGSLLSPDVKSAWQAIVLNPPTGQPIPLTPRYSGTPTFGIDKKTGEGIFGHDFEWKRTSLQFRESPTQPWREEHIAYSDFFEQKLPQDKSGKTWPLSPGQWKETIEVSFELFNESETDFWKGHATYENTIDVTEESNRGYIRSVQEAIKKEALDLVAEKREEEKREQEQNKEWVRVKKETNEYNRKWQAEQDRLNGKFQRMAKLQWQVEGGTDKTWRDIPKPGEKGYPITVQQFEVVMLRAVKAHPDMVWPGLEWKQDRGSYFYSGDPTDGHAEGFSVRGWANNYPTHESKRHTTLSQVTAKCNNQTISTQLRFLPGPATSEKDDDYAYLKSIEWRRTKKEAWHALPHPGSKNLPLTCPLDSGLWFRAIAANSQIGIPAGGFSCQLNNSYDNPEVPTYSPDQDMEKRVKTLEFFVPIKEKAVNEGDLASIKFRCGHQIESVIRILPAPQPAATTAKEAALVQLKILTVYASNNLTPQEKAIQIYVSPTFSRPVRNLALWLEARDAKGAPCGIVNGPGTMDDYTTLRYSERAHGTTRFVWTPGTQIGNVSLTVSLRDKAGRALRRSQAVIMTINPLKVDVDTLQWRRVGQEFVREIRVRSGTQGKGGMSWEKGGVAFRLEMTAPPNSPSGVSWLESTTGITNQSTSDWYTRQHWRFKQGASLYLDNYGVVATVTNPKAGIR